MGSGRITHTKQNTRENTAPLMRPSTSQPAQAANERQPNGWVVSEEVLQ